MITLRQRNGRRLHGVLWDHPTPAAAVLHIHGKGGNFYSGPPRFIPENSSDYPVRHLSLNLRSHDLSYTCDDSPYEDFEVGSTPVDGGYWEDVDSGMEDIGLGVEFLRGLDVLPLFLVGHSSGGWYSARFCVRDADVAAQVMLSPVIDVRRSLKYWFRTDDEFEESCARARSMVAAGDGNLLIPLDRWYYAISARSLLQRVAQPADTWSQALKTSGAPVLMAWGGNESRDRQWQEAVCDITDRTAYSLRIPGAEHNYIGYEAAITDGVLEFISHITDGAVPFSGPAIVRAMS